MPNHVANRIICTGPVEDVAAFKQLMIVEDKSESLTQHTDGSASLPTHALTFDFGRIIPMPEILLRTLAHSRRGPNGRSLLYDTPLTNVFSPPTEREATVEEQEALDGLGYTDWYNWRIDNWGSKWNSYSFGEIKDQATYEFGFDTAWSPPNPVLDKLVERFPKLTFDVAWFDEGWCHAGQGTIGANGQNNDAETLYIEPNDNIYERVYGEPPIVYDDDITTIGQAFIDEAEVVRLTTNFTCFNVQASSDDQGYFPIAATLFSDDVAFSDDELFEMRSVRDRIMQAALEIS